MGAIFDDFPFRNYLVAFLAGVTVTSVVWVFVVPRDRPSSSSAPSSLETSSLEKVTGAETTTPTQIIVDVSGAVKSPGVYWLPLGARVGEALAAAGGVKEEQVDAAYLSQRVNLAAVVTDGQKLYLPFAGETPPVLSTSPALVSINSASSSELDTLPGVGLATVAKIVTGRPYNTLEELVSKKVISQSVFEKLHGRIGL